MNIFVIDKDPVRAAIMLFDKHIVKMALETAQLLSNVNNGPYKLTHVNHPCTKWLMQGVENYDWLVQHGIAICKEYTFRYGKEHKCEEVIMALETPLIQLPKGYTDFVLCMPDEFKTDCAITSYRQYYKSKSSFATWTKRDPPNWWYNGVKL
jgi:hypothetical protein